MQTLKKRYHIKKNILNTFLFNHYKEPFHSDDDIKIDILDHATCESDLRNKENYSIRLPMTAYPYGLNYRIQGYGLISDNINPLGKVKQLYHKLPISIPKIVPSRHKNRRRTIASYKAKELNIILFNILKIK